MLTLYRENGVLYAHCLLKLKKDIKYKNLVLKHDKNGYEDFLEVDAVYKVLQDNGNIKIFNGEKFAKYNLGEFSHLVMTNNYLVEEINNEPPVVPEAKLEKQVQPVVEKPKEEVKVEVKKEEPEQPKEVVEEVKDNNDNKKKRHKNNQQVGDDK